MSATADRQGVIVSCPSCGRSNRLRYNALALAALLMAALTVAKPSLVTTLSSLFDDPCKNPAFTVRQERYPRVG